MRSLILETFINNEMSTYDPNSDVQRQSFLSDTRKPYLTLKHLNKLKKIRQLRSKEKQQQLKNIELVYGNKEEV